MGRQGGERGRWDIDRRGGTTQGGGDERNRSREWETQVARERERGEGGGRKRTETDEMEGTDQEADGTVQTRAEALQAARNRNTAN